MHKISVFTDVINNKWYVSILKLCMLFNFSCKRFLADLKLTQEKLPFTSGKNRSDLMSKITVISLHMHQCVWRSLTIFLGCFWYASEAYFEGSVALDIAILQQISNSSLFWQRRMSLMQSCLKWREYFNSISSQVLMQQVL